MTKVRSSVSLKERHRTMPKYKNIGRSAWKRPDGTSVAPGGTFEATGREHDRIARRVAYQLRLKLVGKVGRAKQADPEEAGWPLKMSPDVYLKLHADGKHAELAQKIVDAAKEEPS